MNVIDNIAEEHPLLSHDFFEDDSGIDELKEQRRAEMKAAETNPEEYIKQAKMVAMRKKAESLIARIKNRQSSNDEVEVEVEVEAGGQHKPEISSQPEESLPTLSLPKMSHDSENIEEVLFNEPQQSTAGSKTIIIHNVKKLIINL